jgi:outer membrane protein insertion porin family
VPFSELDTVFFGLGLERTEITGSKANMPQSYETYIRDFGAVSHSVPLTIGWARDGRDSTLVPTRGVYQRLNLEMGVAADTRYLRTNYQYQQYWPFFNNRFTLMFNGEVGWGEGLSGKPYPIFKNFYGGGLGTVRAFEQGSLGDTDLSGSYIGGTRRVNLNTEFYLPFPGAGNDRTLRWFAYIDAGNVWSAEGGIETIERFRASVGLGLSWISPVGPLKLSIGNPIVKYPSDKIERFQFQIGTSF